MKRSLITLGSGILTLTVGVALSGAWAEDGSEQAPHAHPQTTVQHAPHQNPAPSTNGAAHAEESAHHGGDMNAQMQEMNKMMVQHLGKADAEYDQRFIDMMIPHHEGAILMAEHALKHSKRPEIIAQAKKIIEDQNKEIEQLKQWRKEWYGK